MSLIFAVAVFLSQAVFAHNSGAPKVTEHTVNGFSVHLVDLQQGNQFGYVFTVPYGSSDDDAPNFGRAHFFEHMYARGSKRYPGHETLIKAITGFGMQRNAATSYEHTFYYATGSEDHGLEAMKMHLASLEEPELEASSLAREKATVINEVIKSAPNRPTQAIFSLPFSVLPKEDHPLRGIYGGTLNTLEPMSAEQLRDLHQKIYHAGNVKIAVFGNFTTGKHTRDQVLAQLKAALPAETAIPRVAYRPANLPEIFAEDAVLEIQSDNERLGALFIPIASDGDLNAVNLFLSVFSSRFRGTLTHQLRHSGFAENVNGQTLRVGNQHFAMVSFKMTAAGYAQREQLARFILDSIAAYGQDLVPEGIVSQIRTAFVHAHKQGERDIQHLVSSYSEWLLSAEFQHHTRMDWASAAKQISQDRIRTGARALNLERKVAVLMGPDRTFAHQTSDFFKLKYGVHGWGKSALDLPVLNPSQLKVPTVENLTRTFPTHHYNQWQQFTEAGVHEIYTHDPSWTDRSLMVRLQLPELSAVQQLSLQILMSNVREEIGPELSALASEGISVHLGAAHGEVILSAQGSTGKEASALEWLIDRLKMVPPNQAIINLARESAALSFLKAEEGFPAQVIFGMVRELFSGREQSPLVMTQAIDQVNADSVRDFRNSTLGKSNKILAVAGEFAPEEIRRIKAAIHEISPEALASAAHLQFPRREVQHGLVYRESWSTASQSGVGIARLYATVEPAQLSERAALGIVSELLREQIFLRNRPLGYMQGAGNISNPRNGHILLYGMANDAEGLESIKQVWEEELNRFRQRTVTADELEKARAGLIAGLSERPTSSDQALESISSDLIMSGHPFYSDQLAAALKTVSHDEIFAAVDRYLADHRPTVEITKGEGSVMSCELMLEARQHIRARLVVEP